MMHAICRQQLHSMLRHVKGVLNHGREERYDKVLALFVQLLIDGEFVDSSSGKTFETEDPRTGEVLVEVAEAQEEDVDRAVKAARKVQPGSLLSYFAVQSWLEVSMWHTHAALLYAWLRWLPSLV